MHWFRQPMAKLVLVLLLILGYTSVTRLEGLGRKPYHHDESIHALHSYNLYHGDGWQYDPVYHGPVVYYFNAVGFFLFGDTDYTARVMPAIFGIFMVVLALMLCRELGLLESLYSAAFIALSPTLYYFSRFLRDDVYGCCWTLMMLLGYLRYQRTRDTGWLYFAVIGICLAFCSKVNALIIGFIFCSALLLYGAWYWRAGNTPGTPSDRLKRLAVDYGLIARSLLLFGGAVLIVAVYVVALTPGYPAKGPVRPGYWAATLGGLAFLMVVLDRILARWKVELGRESMEGDSFYERHRTLIGFCLVFFGIFVVLYTNVFRLVPLPGGRDVPLSTLIGNAFVDGLHYWYGQQLHPRIADVWYYYVPRMIIYELPLVILVILGSFVRLTDFQRVVLILGLLGLVAADTVMGLSTGTIATELSKVGLTVMELAFFIGLLLIGAFLASEDLRTGRPERALILYWAILSFIIYAKANEKVPWLGVHVALPLAFYGGGLAADLHRHLAGAANRFSRRLAIGLGLLSVAFYLHGGIRVNVLEESDPKEIMVYVQSTTDVLDVVKEIDQLAYEEGTYYDTRITVEDDASWPFSWYLRHYKNVGHLPTISNLDASTAIVLTNYPPDDQTRAMLENNGYEGTRYKLRAWWQPNWELEAAEATDGLQGYLRYLAKMARYVMYREIYQPDIGSTDFMLYRRMPVQMVAPASNTNALPAEQPKLPETIVPAAPVLSERIGMPGSGPGQLSQPRGLAVGPDGTLYVVDTGNDRIQRFTSMGQFIGSFGSGGSGDGQFNKPGGIAVDREGFVYVADVWNHRVQKFTADGQFVMTWGKEPEFYGPRDLAVSADGQVFVTDTGHHKIIAYSNTGQYIREWGVKGTRFRQFNEPVGITIGPDSSIYVADTGNRRIQVFDLEGKFLRSFAIAGWEFIYSEPYMSFDPAGRLWLTDSKNNRIQAYSNNGRYLGALGGAGEIDAPIGITVDRGSALFVTDTANQRIVRIPLASQAVPAP